MLAKLHGSTRFHRKRAVLWVFLLAVVAGAAIGVCHFFSPTWRVRVDVTHIPPGTAFLSVAAESGGAVLNMDWSPANELSIPFTMHPATCTWSYQRPNNPNVNWDAYVRWQPGTLYGIVTRKTDGTWWVHWFEADAVPLKGRWWLGGGRASFDLTAGQMVPLSGELVAALGLDKVVGLD